MFKKTLLALAITGFAGVASAATIPQLPSAFSAEGVVNETSIPIVDFGNVEVVVGLDNGYGVGDQVVFEFSNDVFDISTTASVTAGNGTGTNVSMTFEPPVYSNGNTVSFTISTVTSAANIGNTLTLEGVVLEGSNLAGGGTITSSFNAVSSVNGSAYEEVTGTVANTADQFGVTIIAADRFSGVVDVNNDRQLFVATSPTTTTTDELTVTATEDMVASSATLNSVTYTLNGDFSFMDTDSDGSPDYGILVDNATDEAIATDLQSITWTSTSGAAAHVVTITASNAGTPTDIPVQTYTVDTTFSYDAATPNAGDIDSTLAVTNDAGEWTLNGSNFTVPYMPFGDNTFPILNVQHTGSLAGEILVSYMLEGSSDGWVSLEMNGTLIQPGLTNLKVSVIDAITAAVLADTGDTNGKVAIDVTISAPTSSISAFAGFKVKHPTTLSESRIAIGTFGDLGTTKNNF